MERRQNTGRVAISRDEWMEALNKVTGGPVEPLDSDALAPCQLAVKWGVSTNTARRRCHQLVKNGIAGRVLKYVKSADGKLQPISAYRLLKEKK